MKNYKQTIENGRFAVEDNGFSAAVLGRLASMPPKAHVVMPVRLSAWREFKLPMIGAAVGILLFGLIVTRIIDFGSWAENYVARTEIFAARFEIKSPPPATDQQVQQIDETNN